MISFRVWMVDKSMHTGLQPTDPTEPRPIERTRIVSYAPIIQQVLRDFVSWVEKWANLSPNTNYTIKNGQVIVPATAGERQSVQQVVSLKINGKDRVDITVGQSVEFVGTGEVSSSTDTIVATNFNFEGDCTFPNHAKFTYTQYPTATIKTYYTFTKPGTYSLF